EEMIGVALRFPVYGAGPSLHGEPGTWDSIPQHQIHRIPHGSVFRSDRSTHPLVMPGLVPVIRVFAAVLCSEDVDGRAKPAMTAWRRFHPSESAPELYKSTSILRAGRGVAVLTRH